MRHARDDDLDQLDALLNRLRGLPGLSERSRGVFYRRSRAYLHFHQDPAGLFADVRTQEAPDFTRHDVTSDEQQAALFDIVQRDVAALPR
jgi:hypothetical protein